MRKLLLTTAAVAAAIAVTLCLVGCSEKEWCVPETADTLRVITYDTLADERDGKTYRTVRMPDGKVWMAENLNYQTPDSSWCYDNNTDSCAKYGRLYAWNASKISCPAGYHLPSYEEWVDLGQAAGGHWWIRGDVFGYGAGNKLKAKNGWSNNDNGGSGDGTDNYGFAALPGGFRYEGDGSFGGVGKYSFWWADDSAAVRMGIDRYGDGMCLSGTARCSLKDVHLLIDESIYIERRGYAVRCVQDGGGQAAATEAGCLQNEAVTYDTLIDERDGKRYKTVKIGRRTWMAENLNYKTWSSTCEERKGYDSCNTYGRLYDWETAMKVCPAGWHLPTRREWHNLVTTVGAAKAGKKLKSKCGWPKYCAGRINGTDDFGFSALPGGSLKCGEWPGQCDFFYNYAFWWTAAGTASTWYNGSAYYRYMHNYDDRADEGLGDAENLYSVRCIADRP
jgi:uncharacterized protein (TIGR02145 family)